MYGDALVFAAAVAMKTQRILLGLGVVEMALHNRQRASVLVLGRPVTRATHYAPPLLSSRAFAPARRREGRSGHRGPRPSQQRDELALGLRIPLDVALRHRQAGMARELLHVPQTPPDLGHSARSAGNEGAAARVRRAAVHLQRGIEPMEPQAHGRRRQPPPRSGKSTAAPGRPCPRARSASDQRRLQVGVQRNGAAAGLALTGAVLARESPRRPARPHR